MTLREQLEALDRYWDHAGILLARTIMDESIRDLSRDRLQAGFPLYGNRMWKLSPGYLNAQAREEVADGFNYLAAALYVAQANGAGGPVAVVRSTREP